MNRKVCRIAAMAVFALAFAAPQGSAQMVLGGAEGDSHLYFFDSGSPTGQSFWWDDSEAKFHLSGNLEVDGSQICFGSVECILDGGGNLAAINYSLNVRNTLVVGRTETSALAYNLFGVDPSPDSGDITVGSDILADDLELDGQLYLSKTIYMEGDSTSPVNGDQTIYFAEGTSRTAEYFRWDDSELDFALSDDLNFDGLTNVYLTNTTGSDLRTWVNQDLEHMIDASNNGTADWWRLYHDASTASASRLAEFEESGDLEIRGTLSQNMAWDIAESFLRTGEVTPGDVVRVDPSRANAVRLATAADGAAVVGVVSTKPGIVLGGSVFDTGVLETWGSDVKEKYVSQRQVLFEKVANRYPEIEGYLPLALTKAAGPAGELTDHEFSMVEKFESLALDQFVDENMVPVALAGRLPVKVEGAVAVGDYLTASTTPGYAKALRGSGHAIGIALEASTEGSDKVLMFVQPGWHGGAELPDGALSPATEGAVGAAEAGDAEMTPTDTAPGPESGSHLVVGFDPGALRAIGESLAGFQPVSEAVELGDVLVADRDFEGWLRRSEMGADPAVVGIVTDSEGVVLGDSLDRFAELDEQLFAELESARASADAGALRQARSRVQQRFDETFAPVAMSGIVRCKVDASYASIGVGDLLSTSPTPGHAMRAEAATPGTILGKALESMEDGTGTIRVLVMLR